MVGKTKVGNYFIKDQQGIMWHEALPLDRLKRVESGDSKEGPQDLRGETVRVLKGNKGQGS